jgi:anti-sigma-K factor RskA
MSGIVNETDLSAFAAEYVIGSLDPDERARANAQLEIDEGFRALVRAWERRLGELHLMVEPVEPDGRIWDRISGRLGIRTPVPPPFVPPPFAPPPFAPAGGDACP